MRRMATSRRGSAAKRRARGSAGRQRAQLGRHVERRATGRGRAGAGRSRIGAAGHANVSGSAGPALRPPRGLCPGIRVVLQVHLLGQAQRHLAFFETTWFEPSLRRILMFYAGIRSLSTFSHIDVHAFINSNLFPIHIRCKALQKTAHATAHTAYLHKLRFVAMACDGLRQYGLTRRSTWIRVAQGNLRVLPGLPKGLPADRRRQAGCPRRCAKPVRFACLDHGR
jgi:hypothetical protein